MLDLRLTSEQKCVKKIDDGWCEDRAHVNNNRSVIDESEVTPR